MYFTWEKETEMYHLRNKMGSTTKKMEQVCIIYNEDTGKILDYGDSFVMSQKLKKMENDTIHVMFTTKKAFTSPEILTELINEKKNILEEMEKDTLGNNYLTGYYPRGVFRFHKIG